MSTLASLIGGQSRKISIIGLGNIGRAVSKNLERNGFIVNKVYDRYSDAFHNDARFQPNIQETARDCDVLITCLGTPLDIKKCVETEHMLDYMPANSVWIDHTTTDYEQTLKFAAQAKENHAISTLECPLTGGITLLKQGQMTMYVGGEYQTCIQCLPILQCSSNNILYIGKIGDATILKVCSNMLASVNTVAMGEILMMVKKVLLDPCDKIFMIECFEQSGIDLEKAWNAIRYSAGNSFVWETEVPLVMNGTYNPNFSLEFQCKDMCLGENIAQRLGIGIPLNAAAHKVYEEARIKYGNNAPSSLPPKLMEDALNEPLQTGGFDEWSYSIKVDQINGAVSVIHDQKK